MTLPRIIILEFDNPSHLRRLKEPRCEMVKPTCSSLHGGQKNRCSRLATVDFDGKQLCSQHAGELSLRYILQNQVAE